MQSFEEKCDILYAEIFTVATHVKRGEQRDEHQAKLQEQKDQAQDELLQMELDRIDRDIGMRALKR